MDLLVQPADQGGVATTGIEKHPLNGIILRMETPARTEQPLLPCPTPCVRHCGIDESLICSGCLRTGREIAAWSKMTDEERWDLLIELEKRKRSQA